MSSIFGIGSGSSASYFSNFFGTSQSGSGVTGSSALSDYSLIRSGSYKKLLNAYYSKQNTSTEQTSEEKKEKLNLVSAKTDAENLHSSAKKLMTTDFSSASADSIKSAMQDFVDAYNKVIDSGSNVDTKSVLRNALWMTKSTSANAGLLSDAGITVGTDNKLTLDATKLEKADKSVLTTLFTGNSSYAGRVMQKASAISAASVTAVADGKSATAYTSSGSEFTQLQTGTLYDAFK